MGIVIQLIMVMWACFAALAVAIAVGLWKIVSAVMTTIDAGAMHQWPRHWPQARAIIVLLAVAGTVIAIAAN